MKKEANIDMDWPHLLAYITGRVDQELLLRNEYLAAENRILRAKITGRLQLSEGGISWWRASLMVRDCDRPSGDRGTTQLSKI